MISVIDFRSSGSRSSPGRGDFVLGSWARYFTVTAPPRSINLMLGVTLRCTSMPSRGEQKYF